MDYKELNALVSSNRYEEVFSVLKTRIPDSEVGLHGELAIIEGKYNDFKKKERMGIISNSEASVERSRVAYSLIEHIESVKKKLE